MTCYGPVVDSSGHHSSCPSYIDIDLGFLSRGDWLELGVSDPNGKYGDAYRGEKVLTSLAPLFFMST